jgi:pimeloyl-ACP methyl ester carboxylesterase
METVVVLGSADGLSLTGFRVLVPSPPAEGPPREAAAALADSVGPGPYRLVGRDAVALWWALDRPESVVSLVLEAPTALHGESPDEDLIARMPGCEVPVLVLFGHADPQAHRGRAYRRLLPRCTYALVHGAGTDLRRDRPDRYARVVEDFLTRDVLFSIGGPA